MREVAQGAYANLVLPTLLREKRVHGRDAAFATELVYGATRMSGLYDAVAARAADRPVDRIDPRVLDTIRLGAHQLLGMRVPTHAAVDETVALARQVNAPHPEPRSPAELLTPRERDVLRLLVVGWTDKEIAAELGISHRTVSGHITAVRAKLDVPSRSAAAAIAVRDRLV